MKKNHDRKAGARRILGCSSAWQAHQRKKCLQECWYCNLQRKMGAKS